MTIAEYRFWDEFEFPLLFGGAILVPLLFATVGTACLWRLSKTYLWFASFSPFFIVSFAISVVLAFYWSLYIDVPLADEYQKMQPPDPIDGGDHTTGNVLGLLVALIVAFGTHAFFFGTAVFLKIARKLGGER